MDNNDFKHLIYKNRQGITVTENSNGDYLEIKTPITTFNVYKLDEITGAKYYITYSASDISQLKFKKEGDRVQSSLIPGRWFNLKQTRDSVMYYNFFWVD